VDNTEPDKGGTGETRYRLNVIKEKGIVPKQTAEKVFYHPHPRIRYGAGSDPLISRERELDETGGYPQTSIREITELLFQHSPKGMNREKARLD